MKIGILSDIHVDLEGSDPQKLLRGFVEAIKENQVETRLLFSINSWEISCCSEPSWFPFPKSRTALKQLSVTSVRTLH